jgi:TetR/AcrR family transcriptional repressor of nem operon
LKERETMSATAEKKPLSHRERLLKEGLRQFYATGFHGTSVDELLAGAGAPKGSFYHHFGSKEAFAHAVVEYYLQGQLVSIGKFAAREDLNAFQKIQAYFAAMQDRFERSGYKVACLVGKFSTELAPSSDDFSSLLATAINDWREAVTSLVAEGHRDGSIRRDMTTTQQSTLVLSLIQGGLVVALAERSGESLASIQATLAKLLSSKYDTRRATSTK